uniref:Uncharacterized protein n=1 Tax=Sphaerodactylus townsendi TaxID=933632 RepID=A0ACB8F611_9SAUR
MPGNMKLWLMILMRGIEHYDEVKLIEKVFVQKVSVSLTWIGFESNVRRTSKLDFPTVDMELSASELSIYDKLSETIDLVRQTGYQCGMPEKAIERFIRQLLEKNEPQRGPPRYPLLVVLYKGLITLGLVLLTAYFMIQPYTLSPPEATLTKAHAWGSLISHIRLLPLPITKKYMLESKEQFMS